MLWITLSLFANKEKRTERIKTEKGGGRIQRRQMEKTGVLYRSLSFFLSSVILESELLFIYLCLFGKWGKTKWKRGRKRDLRSLE
jgi:hypothetical protein